MTPVIHRRDGKMDFRELVCGHMKDMSTDVCECAHAKETKKKVGGREKVLDGKRR